MDIINNNDLFEVEINYIKSYIKEIKVCQTFHLYNYLDPDNLQLKEIKQMINKNKENEENQKPASKPEKKKKTKDGKAKKKF